MKHGKGHDMAEGMNKVIVMGNLGQDPELRSTQGGASVMTLSLAINESYLDANKERQQRTEWVRVVVWGKRAEGLARSVSGVKAVSNKIELK